MLEYLEPWFALKTDKRAVTALEYGLIAAVIIVVALGAFSLVGNNLSTMMNNTAAVLK
jgi:pilus assembly protein Flp/PilA